MKKGMVSTLMIVALLTGVPTLALASGLVLTVDVAGAVLASQSREDNAPRGVVLLASQSREDNAPRSVAAA